MLLNKSDIITYMHVSKRNFLRWISAKIRRDRSSEHRYTVFLKLTSSPFRNILSEGNWMLFTLLVFLVIIGNISLSKVISHSYLQAI